MARADAQPGLTPSLLDRFIDPRLQGDAPLRPFNVSEMAEVVRRDLEDLLNTRQSNHTVPASCVEVRRSLISFGMPDLATLTPEQQREVGTTLAAIVEMFEPRLKNVQAERVEEGERKDRSIRFRIKATLHVEPAPEVAFDTVLELTTGSYSIQHSAS